MDHHDGTKKFEILLFLLVFESRQKCAGKCAVAVQWSPYDLKVPKSAIKLSQKQPWQVVGYRDASIFDIFWRQMLVSFLVLLLKGCIVFLFRRALSKPNVHFAYVCGLILTVRVCEYS